jgi:hypothetical protein
MRWRKDRRKRAAGRARDCPRDEKSFRKQQEAFKMEDGLSISGSRRLRSPVKVAAMVRQVGPRPLSGGGAASGGRFGKLEERLAIWN